MLAGFFHRSVSGFTRLRTDLERSYLLFAIFTMTIFGILTFRVSNTNKSKLLNYTLAPRGFDWLIWQTYS